MMEEAGQSLEETLRGESLERITIYTHPKIVLKHEPINARECEELQAQLREKIREKVEKVRREYEAQDYNNKYQQVYGQFVKMTITNEAQQQAMCRDMQEMHEIADILMNPPPFGKDLFLSSKQPPNAIEAMELKNIYEYYQKLYKQGSKKQENEADQAIKRAKQFILKQ